MTFWNRFPRLRAAGVVAVVAASGVWMADTWRAQAADTDTAALVGPFEQTVKPFLKKNCVRCHNVDTPISGIRVDGLDASLDDKHMKLWGAVRRKAIDGTMPPKGQPQPTAEERDAVAKWAGKAIEIARSRPTPMNGSTRRLTVAQYKNTLRELLGIDDDFTEILPPDAISRDGFVNNKDTQQMSPLLVEAYFEIAEKALDQAIVDPNKKPAIQNFRMDLGESINPKPFPDPLILGANSMLLDNKDFTVTQLKAVKPFPFEPFMMRTKYRFIEGYAGNDTVRGWREYDSIYHAVFADVRGAAGYPKGRPYDPVPQGLLLRPAIPNDEIFTADGTYGPKANFKISLRELPDEGRFRVTVTAAKYNDGLLLDQGAAAAKGAGAIVATNVKSPQTVTVPKAGLYQVDVHAADRLVTATPDVSRLKDGLAGVWPSESAATKLEGGAKVVDSPLGKAVSLDAEKDFVTVTRDESLSVGEGEFTVAAWIHPQKLQRAGIASSGAHSWTHGWVFDMPGDKGTLRIETSRPDGVSNGAVTSPQGVIKPEAWQHVAAVVRRGKQQTYLYVNGYPVAKGTIEGANLDNSKLNLQIGRVAQAPPFKGELAGVRLYRRALSDAEIQGLVEPGRQFATAPPEKPQDVVITLGDRKFSGTLQQPAFVVARFEAGPLAVRTEHTGMRELDRVVLTPVAAGDEIEKKFLAFEKRSPRVGVHLGLRRDCGSTLAPVGPAQTVSSTKLSKFVFEGAIRNFPSPDVEKDNVNYLAGVREIGVRSEYTDGRDMPRLVVRAVEFEGPYYDQWPPKSHKNIFIESAHKNDPQAYGREIVKAFATKAFRRPLKADEEAMLTGVFAKSYEGSKDFKQAVKDALQVVLTSPQFLFLVEKSETPKPEALDDYELASKLSYFLWNGPPDRQTLRLAATKTLRAQLDAEITRMVADSKFARFAQEFGSQWLALEKFAVLEPDRKRYPKLTRDVRAQLKAEPVEFLQYLMRKNLPLKSMIESDVVLANEVVASYYDLDTKPESGFNFVPVAHRRKELGGVLTQAAIMAGLSDGRESNPVKRGAWLARRIIAEPPDDPPPNVPALKEDTQNLTLRQRIERHRNQPGCFQCHSKIDPWGVAFEEFDAGGRLKTQPADAHSKLPDDAEVTGINDLKRHLGEDRIDQVAFSVLKHLTTYAAGRSLTYYEVGRLRQDALKLKPTGYRMQDMIRFVAHSEVFLQK